MRSYNIKFNLSIDESMTKICPNLRDLTDVEILSAAKNQLSRTFNSDRTKISGIEIS